MSRQIVKYRRFLYCLLIGGICALTVMTYFTIWSRVPSKIMLKAGVDQELDLKVPASGEIQPEILAVNGNATSAGTEGLYIDLAKPLTIKVSEINNYTVDLKLFGIIPLKNVEIEVIQNKKLKPAGFPIGIYVKTKGVLVVGVGEFEGETGQTQSPARYILKSGDYITKVNEEPVESKKKLIEQINHSEGQELLLEICREDELLTLKIQPVQNQKGEYKLGIWVRDNAQGVGTMTYIDENNCFGALGHGINDVDTSTLMNLESGTLYHTEIVGITRGSGGAPGELTGFIEYDEANVLGAITQNEAKGIFGVCREETVQDVDFEAIPIGLKQEIELGEAQIICSVGDQPQYYDIEITEIHLENDNINRGIVLKITDPELLAITGGIVQGMSGSPIIQNGRIVGAVTHVLVQDATRGYGIFIETMLEQG